MNKKSAIRTVYRLFSMALLLSLLLSIVSASGAFPVYAKDSRHGISIANTPNNALISNSLFLYASTIIGFDTQSFLDEQSGPLKGYSETIDGQNWSAADSIEYIAIYYGINPQVILILLEAENNLITQANSQIPTRPNPIGSREFPKFYYHVKLLAETASFAFHSRRDHQDSSTVDFSSGETTTVDPSLNAGTYGLQTSLAKILSTDKWKLWTAGRNPLFKQTYATWFGDPMSAPDTQEADAFAVSALAIPGGYNLPFPVGSTWYYTGGPHTYTGSGARPWSSVDIAPPEVISCPGGSYPAGRWIVAARGGTVITSQTALIVIDHGDGWRTYYSHVSTADRRGTGGVNQGDNLGHPSCEVEPSGSTSGVHVHFAIYQVGTGFVNISGSSLSDWLITETSHYNGTMTRQGVTRTATTGRHNGTNDIYNSGSGGVCPAPPLNNPSDGYVSTNQTVSFSWSAISGCTFNGYTLRIRTDTNMDGSGNIYDQGVGELSRSVTIGSEYNNRDLYWGVRAANAPNGANWAIRRFRIQPGGCPSLSAEVKLYDGTNCGGDSTTANNTGLWSMASTFNDRAESIAIASGWSARLYLHDSEGSPSACFGGTDTDLWNNTFSDGTTVANQATWMRVYNNTSCTNGNPPDPPSPISPPDGHFFNEGESITLSWSATGNEYYGEISGGPGSTLTFGWQAGTSKNIGSQWAGYQYTWKVKARNSYGESGWSSGPTFTVRPAAPSNLSASVVSCSQINLSWSDNSGNEEGYKVYRDGNLIATLPSGSTSYPDTGLIGNRSYSYIVKAYRGSIESNVSNTANATTGTCPVTCPTITHWKGEYWNNTDLSGQPALCRNDVDLNFDWGTGNPDPLITGDPFSARWTRTFDFSGGTYRFHIHHDDGARIYIDDVLVPGGDFWNNCCVWDSVDLQLQAGAHTIRLEYAETGGAAFIELWWERIGPSAAPADFDGDGDTDVGVYRSSQGMWYIKDQFSTGYGVPGDIPMPGDYDGDGDTDLAIYRPSQGMWYVKGQFFTRYGIPGDIPMPGDYDGDGDTDVAIYRPSQGMWYVKGQFFVKYGIPGDIPVPGDYDGDGDTDVAIFRPSQGMWYVKDQFIQRYGIAGDVPVPGDYDGDGDTDVAIYRPSQGMWYVKDQFSTRYGIPDDIPVPGDYDGDGDSDLAVYRPSQGMWYVKDQFSTRYGVSTDFPLPVRDTNGDGDPYQ